MVLTCTPAGSHNFGHPALAHWSVCYSPKVSPQVQKLLIQATWASATVHMILLQTSQDLEDSLTVYMFIPAQSDTTHAVLSAADKLLFWKFSFISLKSLHRMASVFPSLLQSLSLITRVAPCNTGGSGNGVLQWAPLSVSRSVSRAPCFWWKKNIFELNVAWFPCPFFQGYFLSSILKTPHFLQGLALFIISFYVTQLLNITLGHFFLSFFPHIISYVWMFPIPFQ